MLVRVFLALALVAAAWPASAETIQLKDQASVSGKILAEKRDQVVVDLGFTVLSIPKSSIAKISKEAAPDPKASTKNGRPTNGRPANGRASTPTTTTEVPAAPAPVVSAPRALFQGTRPGLEEQSVRELVKQLGEAVVQVRAPSGLGSGFILNEEGYLITNFHVIEGETQLSVEVYHVRNGQLDRRSYKQIRIVAMNKFQDLALLKIEDKDAPKFASVPLGDSDVLSVGERVFAIGSPLGLERTVTEGIVSTKTRQLMGELYLQTTAQINPGNSGGPLFNLRGEVVGVTNMKLAFGEGLGFAIPVEAVRYFLRHRDAYAYDNDNPSNPYRYLEPPSRLKLPTDSDQEAVR
jgi:serine protease Do